jgi:hypothetical protein
MCNMWGRLCVQEYSPDWMREQYIEHYYEYVNYTRNQQWDLSSIHHRYCRFEYFFFS